ncbi:hypothetical protein SAMN04487996_10532 [Dyadobacter soli]|uniref:Uncharacterized protein n=1 Tax=Dyadobacter soli TaxID=659014 RepID=A0A1G7CVD0_9BACT|nr:DUF6625 family protein [Dyadobacter soli]SDE43302.1 hypothetical protein SAMN04487996_10532 [Dyadobacter soli]
MKVAFIIPYFGKLPSNFDLWLKTCKANPEFNWLIVGDNKELPTDLADNVTYQYFKDMDALSQLINEKLGLNIRITRPYKLCDYKGLYGAIFSEYLVDYDFWGYCDMDMFFGKISNYLTPEVLDSYDVIQRWGHLTAIRNNEAGVKLYEKCFAYSDIETVLNWPMCQGTVERIMPYVALNEGLRCYYNQAWIADLNFEKFEFEVVGLKTDNYASQVFTWENGVTYRYFLNEGRILRDEFMYVHLQKRAIDILDNVTGDFVITPNGLYSKTKEISLADFVTDSQLKVRFDKRFKKMWNRIIMKRFRDTFFKGKLFIYLTYKRYISKLWASTPDITITKREQGTWEVVSQEAGLIS